MSVGAIIGIILLPLWLYAMCRTAAMAPQAIKDLMKMCERRSE